jgi:hypothetical protein
LQQEKANRASALLTAFGSAYHSRPNGNASEQQQQIEALSAGLQEVSAQLEMSRPAPRVVENIH